MDEVGWGEDEAREGGGGGIGTIQALTVDHSVGAFVWVGVGKWLVGCVD